MYLISIRSDSQRYGWRSKIVNCCPHKRSIRSGSNSRSNWFVAVDGITEFLHTKLQKDRNLRKDRKVREIPYANYANYDIFGMFYMGTARHR